MPRLPKSFLAGLALISLIACAPPPQPEGEAHDHEEHAGHAEHEGHEESEHHHPGHVELSPKQQQLAAVTSQAVQWRDFSGEFQTSGLLTYDQDLQVRVTSRLPGKVLRLQARLGEWVQAGQLLAVIDCPELVRYKAEYHESETDLRLAQQSLQRRQNLARYGDEIHRPLDDARNEVSQAQAELEVARSQARVQQKTLQRVQELLVDGITSKAQLEQARADTEQAQAVERRAQQELKIAQEHLRRELRLQGLGTLASKENQEAKAQVERTQERTQHLREGLEALQADPDSHGSTIEIKAPIAGVVSSRPITLGESVTPEEELFTLVNTHRLWLWVNTPEQQLERLQTGQSVAVEVAAFPKRTFTGKISHIAPQLDEKTRNVRALVVIDNPDQKLKPAMTARVRVASGNKKSLVIPATALETIENKNVVYRHTEANVFERTNVELGQRSGEWVEVTKGLKAGEQVVTQGSHILKSEDLKEQLEEGGHKH